MHKEKEPPKLGSSGQRLLAAGAWLIPKIHSFLTSVILLNSVAARRGARDEAAPGVTLQGLAFDGRKFGILAFALQCISVSLNLF